MRPTCALWRTVDVLPWNACDLCTHGITVDGSRFCTRREVVGSSPMKPVEPLREPNGPCGLEAEFLDFPGLHHP